MTRGKTLVAILVLAAIGYLLLLLLASPSVDLPTERKLRGPAGGEPQVHIYLEVVGIDAVRNAMQVEVSVEPTGLGIDTPSMPPDRDLVLVLNHDKRGERIAVHGHHPVPTTLVELDLNDGDITDYPLDAYRASLEIQCFDASSPSGARPSLLPMDLTLWERVLGFRLRTTPETATSSGVGRLNFRIHRTTASIFFAVAAYGAMVVLACVALTIGTLTFLGIRRAEATLMGVLGAIVFALPALRNALPGSAPLGVSADMLMYLWAELAVVFSLALVATTWARSGPAP